MTIRYRTERPARSTSVPAAFAVAGLTATGALHAMWACGSTWPAADAEGFVQLIMGVPAEGPTGGEQSSPRGLPSSGASLAVAAALLTAAVLTAAAGGLVSPPGRRAQRVARVGTQAAAGVLLARGVGGLTVSSLALMPATDLFRRWDVRVYSPLCLALGVAGLHAARCR